MTVFDTCRTAIASGANVVLVSGYSRLPDSVASHAQFERIGVVLVVDLDSGAIVAAEPTLLTTLAKDFFRALVEDLNVYTEPDQLVARIEQHYHGGTGPALATALRKCLERIRTLRGAA